MKACKNEDEGGDEVSFMRPHACTQRKRERDG